MFLTILQQPWAGYAVPGRGEGLGRRRRRQRAASAVAAGGRRSSGVGQGRWPALSVTRARRWVLNLAATGQELGPGAPIYPLPLEMQVRPALVAIHRVQN